MTTQNKGTQRAELAAIYVDTLNKGHGVIDRPEQGERAADAILAAGYRKPRIITTGRELDALSAGAVVLGRDKVACQKEEALGLWDSPERLVSTDFIALPATVLWEPEAEVGA